MTDSKVPLPKYDPSDSPIAGMMDILQRAGRISFDGTNPWEACLCALILALEPKCKTYQLLEALPYRETHLDKIDMLNTIAHLGYTGQSVETHINKIDPRLLPCVFIPKNKKPFVILEEKDGKLKIFKNSRIKMLCKEKLPSVSGIAWIFERFDESKTATSRFMRGGTGYSWFRAMLARFHSTFAQILLAGLALNVLALSSPIFIMLVYDRVISAGSLETLPMLVLGVAMAIGFEWELRRVRSLGLSWLAARMDNIVGNKIFMHLIDLPPHLIEKASVAAQIARIKTFEAVRDFFSGSVFLSMLELPFVVLAAVAIYAIAGPLVLVPLSMIASYALVFFIIMRHVKTAIRLAAKANSARQQFSIETFEKIQGVRGYGLSAVWQAKFRELSGREMLAHFKLNWLGTVAETLANALTLLAAVATVAFGVHLIWAGIITTGALVATMILVWRVLTPFYSLCTMIPRLEQLRNSIIQVNALMDLDTEALEAKTAARLPKMRGHVAFVNASLKYSDDGDFVLSRVNFEARPGDLVMVTGENGAGKTSFLKLIKGLYRAQEGSVQIDTFDIRQLDAPDLRRQIAYVPQQPDFFNGSILENMRIGNPLASADDIQKALELADAWNDVMNLPDKLDTKVGRYGVSAMPPSLASRLSLARAYLHPAPILLIDELPNTLLSGRIGKNLKDYLARTKGKRTTIMITYREDFMNLADTIIILRRGEDANVGAREEMLIKMNKREAA